MLSKNQIKFIRSLENKKNRQDERMFVAEGVKIIRELLNSDFQVSVIYCTEKYLSQLAPGIIKKNIPLELVSENELQKISFLETNNTALALIHSIDNHTIDSIKDKSILILDGISDPGNFGTIIRTADWFGVTSIFCSENTVDLYNPKVIQSTMGSIAHVRVYRGEIVTFLNEQSFKEIYGTFLSGIPLNEVAKISKEGTAIVMGSESHGISKEVEKMVTQKITIPAKGNAESLNVAISCGIVLNQLLT